MLKLAHKRVAVAILLGAVLVCTSGGFAAATPSVKASPRLAPASAPCTNAAAAEAQVAKQWRASEAALGVPYLTPPKEVVCYVTTTKYKKKGLLTIGFASQGPTNSWAASSDAYVRYDLAQNHVSLDYASANGSGATQVSNVEDLVSEKPDLLIVQPLNSAVEAGIHRAAQEGIPVVVCTGELSDTNDITATVNHDYALQGTLFAQWIVKELHGQGEIAMISGIAGAPTAEVPYQAALAFFKHYPGIKIMTHQYDNWSETQAKTVAASMLVQYPGIKAVWSDSSFTDVGVAQAYTAAHKAIPIVTGDSSNAFLRVAKQYHMTFALSSYPPEQCGMAVSVAIQILEGKTVLNQVQVPNAVYTQTQLGKYYRANCSDNLWVPSLLPEPILKQLDLC